MKPWKQLAKKTIRLNRYRQIHKVRYQLPDGTVGDFYLVERGVVVATLVVTQKRRIVVAQQFRPGPNRVLSELPGGMVEKNETPRQAAIRETLEETGYRGKITYLGRSSNDAWSTLTRHHFLVTEAEKVGATVTDHHEFIQPKEISLSQLRRNMKNGDLTDTETAYRGLDYLGWL